MSDKFLNLIFVLSIIVIQALWILRFDKESSYSSGKEKKIIREKEKRLESIKNCPKFAFLFEKR